jgi:hypothetical protein
MEQQADPRAAAFPRAVKKLLQQGLELRDRQASGTVSAAGMAVAIGWQEAKLDRLLASPPAG